MSTIVLGIHMTQPTTTSSTRIQGTQGMVLAIVRQMGRQYAVGRDKSRLLLKIDDFWPNFRAFPEAVEALFAGFADRFEDATTTGRG